MTSSTSTRTRTGVRRPSTSSTRPPATTASSSSSGTAAGFTRPPSRWRSPREPTLVSNSAILSFEEREEISRAIARTLGLSHTTIAREINRCGGRRHYRPHAAEREAWRRSRRPRPTRLELFPELRRLVEQRLQADHSPEQIAGWLRVRYPDNEAMQVSHETIYRALYVQARGA